ncbi:MAG: hypothetical protein COA68_07645 [Oceanobacter sp.]|nr:MAG: hypothetical protein COA68_07645 [Oceanobacter sp.]
MLLTIPVLLLPTTTLAWIDDDRYGSIYTGGYSGEGRWYLSGAAEVGTIDQQLTDADRSFSYTAPKIAVGGVGPRAIRFEFGWSRVISEDQDWGITGFDGDLWLPWEPHRRIRPYLILGMGYHKYYGAESDFLESNNADNGARSLNAGLAVMGNITKLTEMGITFRYLFITWTASAEAGEDVPDANATISSVGLRVQRLF